MKFTTFMTQYCNFVFTFFKYMFTKNIELIYLKKEDSMINTKKTLSWHLILITIIIVCGSIWSANGHPEMPHTFYGSVTGAVDGQTINAYVNNISTSSTVNEGWYVNLDVPADDPETLEREGGCNGDSIYFSIDGQPVGNCIFNIGGFNRLDFNPNLSSNSTLVVIQEAVDNRLRESTPDTVLGGDKFIDAGKIDNFGNFHSIIWFDLSRFNSTDFIETATLSMFWYYENHNHSTNVCIYRPADWDANYVTWNSHANNIAWINPGGDWYDKDNTVQGAEPFATVAFPADTPPDNMYHDFNITELVQDYVTGTYDNTGFFIEVNEIENSYIAFYSSDSSNTSQQPRLTITYTPETEPLDHAPVLNTIGNKSVNEGSLLEFSILASDPDGDDISYSAANLPGGASFDSAALIFSWTPDEGQEGLYNVHFEVTDGSLTDTEDITITVNNISQVISQPSVKDPTSTQFIIPDDTDNNPLWGETSQLTVNVTSDNGIDSVTIDLSAVGGSSTHSMENIGGNTWSATTNAAAGTPPRIYDLQVNATDIHGHSNTSVEISLKVIRNGDTSGDDIVNIADAMLLANHISHPDQYTISSVFVADVTGDGIINIADAMLLANSVSYSGHILC